MKAVGEGDGDGDEEGDADAVGVTVGVTAGVADGLAAGVPVIVGLGQVLVGWQFLASTWSKRRPSARPPAMANPLATAKRRLKYPVDSSVFEID